MHIFHVTYNSENHDTTPLVDNDGTSHISWSLCMSGSMSILAGQEWEGGSATGSALSARFNSLRGIVVDSYKRVLLACEDNHAIRCYFNGCSYLCVYP